VLRRNAELGDDELDVVTRSVDEEIEDAVAFAMDSPPGDRDLALCDAQVAACFASQDYIEGRTAFMEKRRPQFTGT